MKCFVLNSTELTKRMDTNYHTPEKAKLYNKIKNNKLFVPLGNIIKECSYGILPKGTSYSIDNPIKLLRASEMRPDLEIDICSKIRVPEEYYKYSRARLKKNDILIAVKGATIASDKSVAFNEVEHNDILINGSIFRFQVVEGINPKYIAYLLTSSILKEQMKFNLISNNAVDYLSKDIIESLLIPIPKKTIQNNIVELLDARYHQRKILLEEVATELGSLDEYIMKELDINDASVKNRKCFPVKISKMKGNRIDALYYTDIFHSFKKNILSSKYKVDVLASAIDKITNGFDYRKFTDEGTKYIRVSNIKPFELSLDTALKINISIEDIKKDIKVRKGNLLITRKGTYGNCVLIDKDEEFIVSSEIFIVSLKEKFDPKYLEAILNSKIALIQYEQVKIGAIMGSLSQDALKSILIPVPPKDKQKEIGIEIAKKLENIQKKKIKAEIDIEVILKELLFTSMGDNYGD